MQRGAPGHAATFAHGVAEGNGFLDLIDYRHNTRLIVAVSSTRERGEPSATYGSATDYLWQNGTGEGHAFQDARGSFEIALRIATRTARHVGLVGHCYFGGIRRDDGFASRREGGDRDGDQSD
jgi:hypothetical protein